MAQSEIQLLSASAADSSIRLSRSVCAAAACYAILGGGISLLGWLLDIRRLTDWRNDDISMFANTAACAVLAGIALLLLVGQREESARSITARILAAMVALVGLLTLAEHLFAVDLGIDTLLSNRSWGQKASTAPMRMGPPASTAFVAIGVAILLASYGRAARRVASLLAILVVSIASLSLIGYWFGADELFGVAHYTGIAWQTSTMLMALGIGLVAAMPERGIMIALGRDDAGGAVLRRLIVPIIGIPLLLGWLRVLAQNAELYDMAFGTAVRTLAEIVLFVGLLWWTATGISQHADAARKAERGAARERGTVSGDCRGGKGCGSPQGRVPGHTRARIKKPVGADRQRAGDNEARGRRPRNVATGSRYDGAPIRADGAVGG